MLIYKRFKRLGLVTAYSNKFLQNFELYRVDIWMFLQISSNRLCLQKCQKNLKFLNFKKNKSYYAQYNLWSLKITQLTFFKKNDDCLLNKRPFRSKGSLVKLWLVKTCKYYQQKSNLLFSWKFFSVTFLKNQINISIFENFHCQ